MKNSKYILIFVLLSLIVGVITYVSTSSYIYGIGVFLVYTLYFIVIGTGLINRYANKTKKMKECYNFINNYIISLSAKNSFVEAFNSATIGAKGELQKEIEHINDLDPLEKIKYLQDYFNNNTYQMFLNIIDSFVDNGGDILTMSKLLLDELTRLETNQMEFERKGKGKVLEFIIMWILTFIILILLRVSLNQFQTQLISSMMYTIGLLVFFLFSLVSIHVLISGYTNEKLFARKAKWN